MGKCMSDQEWFAKRTWRRGVLAVFLFIAVPGQASDWGDHDRARQALEAGEILPLGTVLEKIEREMPGRVLEVELERKRGSWVYEIRLLRQGGALVKLLVDARDGSIIAQRERDARPDR